VKCKKTGHYANQCRWKSKVVEKIQPNTNNNNEEPRTRRTIVNSKPLLTPCNLNDIPLIACLDTGADISILDAKFAKKHNLEIKPQKINLKQTFQGHPMSN